MSDRLTYQLPESLTGCLASWLDDRSIDCLAACRLFNQLTDRLANSLIDLPYSWLLIFCPWPSVDKSTKSLIAWHTNWMNREGKQQKAETTTWPLFSPAFDVARRLSLAIFHVRRSGCKYSMKIKSETELCYRLGYNIIIRIPQPVTSVTAGFRVQLTIPPARSKVKWSISMLICSVHLQYFHLRVQKYQRPCALQQTMASLVKRF